MLGYAGYEVLCYLTYGCLPADIKEENMKKYIWARLARSVLSLILAITLIYTIIYTMVPRSNVFKNDPQYTKLSATPDKKVAYKNSIYQKIGYIEFLDSKELQAKAQKAGYKVTKEGMAPEDKKELQAFLDKKGGNWKLGQYESKRYYATREVPVWERVLSFYGNLIQIDHPWKIQDPNNKDLPRYIAFKKDKSVGWALTGSGTEHKYLVYVNGQFPFIHQNFVTFDFGISYPTYADREVIDVIAGGQGAKKFHEVTFPTGIKRKSTVDIYTRTYQTPSRADKIAIRNYGVGDAYTKTKSVYEDPSMIVNSVIIGLSGLCLAYLLAVPLGVTMARFKNRWFDTTSTVVLSFLMALPSIALVYIVRFIGSSIFGLPGDFTILGAHDIRSYILPSIILGLLTAPGIAIWIRRYMIDLQSSDFVRFARAKGLTEGEIARRHILKNALVPLVQGIPTAIVGVIAGATFTETIFAFPGMGKMMIDSVQKNNNSMVIALSFIFATMGVLGVFLGDILMTIVDPRISLSSKKGGNS